MKLLITLIISMLKKQQCIYLILLFLPLISSGQFQLGGRGGFVVYSFTHTDESPHENAQYGYTGFPFSISLTARQRTSKSFNIGTELEYTNRSFTVESKNGGLGGGSGSILSYSVGNLYLHIQPQFVFGPNLKFFFYPGFYFGKLLHSSVKGITSFWRMGPPSLSNSDSINGSAKGHYPQFEFGIAPGIGLEFPIQSNLNLVLEYQFTMNLAPLAGYWTTDKVKRIGMNFKIGIAYTFLKNHSKLADKEIK